MPFPARDSAPARLGCVVGLPFLFVGEGGVRQTSAFCPFFQLITKTHLHQSKLDICDSLGDSYLARVCAQPKKQLRTFIPSFNFEKAMTTTPKPQLKKS